MKVWNGHGSEHSAGLVMIGCFKSEERAQETLEILNEIHRQASREHEASDAPDLFEARRFTDQMGELLNRRQVYSLGPRELSQFVLDTTWRRDGATIQLDTEEVEISAFIKLMVQAGARIEVYSKHDYPEAESMADEE